MKEKIDLNNLPNHIAIIMDGNGRWAKKKGAARIFGHRTAVKAVREVTEGCTELGINYLTLYAFSTENWGRPREEVNALMELLVQSLRDELDDLLKNNIILHTIGDIQLLPIVCQKSLAESIKATENNTGLTLTLALNYSGRQEITESVKKIAEKVLDGSIDAHTIDAQIIEKFLYTKGIPDPELLIRTSGEMRVSNFLLWQIAYTELYITEVLWPDFRRADLYKAILAYQKRERRFGKISEQVKI